MSYSTYNYTDNNRHNAVSSWFLGPRAENFKYLEEFFHMALEAQRQGRNSYFPEDQVFVTEEMQNSDMFKESIARLKQIVEDLSKGLCRWHVPFWNPRYNGHMNMDTTMPGIVGYLTTMIYNPNNVAAEASPLTTLIEQDVGRQLCDMIGINVLDNGKRKGWGHITCDGSVANLESVWAARNLKFYPLSLTLAMENDGPLSFIRDTFKVKTCTGTEKLLKDFRTWELLNITPDDVLDIPDRLYEQYSISPTFLQNTMNNYVVQTVARDSKKFVNRFGLENINHIAYITSATRHYSWPKGAAVTGIGSENLLDVTVDDYARMDMDDLRAKLDDCLKDERRAIYAVVAITGSTEHGACDPLKDILDLRTEYQKKGLSFVVHADGAWGTYYHSTLNPKLTRHDGNNEMGFVPSMPLKPKTEESLKHLRFCESITVDPHKSGYLQYPAGGLLYRDERMRYLVTWTSPVVYREDEESIGVYGIEGSKPGAAPVATWVSHLLLGLDQDGYGTLLGEGIFGSVKMYAHLVTMSTPQTDFRVTPLIMLPAEAEGSDVEAQKDFIRKRILNIPNRRLVEDKQAMDLVKRMGSDLSINTFAVNFIVNGKVNDDIVEANYLNTRIFNRLSITSIKQDLSKIPLFITSTQFSQKEYGRCLTTYKRRLGLDPNLQHDLYSLINVVSSPFPTEGNFTAKIAATLEQVIKEEVKIAQYRNTIKPTFHGFVMQGTTRVFLTHLPMFNMADHRYQLIITGDLPPHIMMKYVAARKENPGQYFTLGNAKPLILEEMIKAGSFDAVIDKGLPPPDGSHFLSDFQLTNIQVLKMERLDSKFLSMEYPKKSMPFYIYGVSSGEVHIDHALLASPNIQLNSDCVKLEITSAESQKITLSFDGTLVVHLMGVPEIAMQPFPSNEAIKQEKSFFFRPQAVYDVVITKDLSLNTKITEGKLQLSDTVFIDTDMLNENPMPDNHYQLHSALDHYTSEKTIDHPSIPLLAHVPPTDLQEWKAYVEAIKEGNTDTVIPLPI